MRKTDGVNWTDYTSVWTYWKKTGCKGTIHWNYKGHYEILGEDK